MPMQFLLPYWILLLVLIIGLVCLFAECWFHTERTWPSMSKIHSEAAMSRKVLSKWEWLS